MATKEPEANPAPKLVDQPNAVPTNKVIAYTAGAILAAIVMRVVETYSGFGFSEDQTISQGLPIVLGAVLAYFMRDNANTPPTKGD